MKEPVTINGIEQIGNYTIETYRDGKAQELEEVKWLFLKGRLGVAENGAVWITDTSMHNRMLPFICENLVLVVNGKTIVPTLHHAYERISIDEEGYGVFVAGPSKTADIEQSLVIGAHGPLSLYVFIITE